MLIPINTSIALPSQTAGEVLGGQLLAVDERAVGRAQVTQHGLLRATYDVYIYIYIYV